MTSLEKAKKIVNQKGKTLLRFCEEYILKIGIQYKQTELDT